MHDENAAGASPASAHPSPVHPAEHPQTARRALPQASAPSTWDRSSLTTLVAVVREDRSRHGSWLLPGTQAMALHRLGEWMQSASRSRLSRVAARVAYRLGYPYVRNVLGIELPPTVQLGRGVHLVHQHGVAVHPYARIGDRTKIHHMVTIGLRDDRDTSSGPEPTIGADVLIGVGATILGGVTIGDGATIGPHAVVTKDVPAGATVVAAPSRSLRLR